MLVKIEYFLSLIGCVLRDSKWQTQHQPVVVVVIVVDLDEAVDEGGGVVEGEEGGVARQRRKRYILIIFANKLSQFLFFNSGSL